MILTLDVGNTQMYGGLFQQDQLVLQFRRSTQKGVSSDELGLFLRVVIKENNFDPQSIKQIAICSVVPDLIYALKGACKKYFNLTPFTLDVGVKTGLKIKYRNPVDVGADRIANAIAATHLYPAQNLILVDLGTATTFCAVSAQNEYLGGCIIPGLKISMESLESRTAKLPKVEIIKPREMIGRSTVECIQSGLYHGHLGAIKEMTLRMNQEFNSRALIIGTGGLSSLFASEKIFDAIVPDLVLRGLYLVLKMNMNMEAL